MPDKLIAEKAGAGVRGNAFLMRVIKGSAICLQKVLDRIDGPILYKSFFAIRANEIELRNISMMTSRTHKGHSTKAQADGVYVMSLSLSPSNIFGGMLGQRRAQSKDSRQIKH